MRGLSLGLGFSAGGGVAPGPPAPAFAAFDTQDGGLFIPDIGFAPDHSDSFAREYEIENEGVWRQMDRPSAGSGATAIRIAGYRTAAAHDLTGSGRIRFRDTVDGVQGEPSAYQDYAASTTAPLSVTTFDPFGDGRITATFSAAKDALVCETDANVLFVWGATTVNSVFPAQTTSPIDGFVLNGAAVNPSALNNPFMDNDVLTYGTASQASFPQALNPGDIFVFSRADAAAVDGASNSPLRNMACIVVLDERPPAGCFAPAPYANTGGDPRARTMLHTGLIGASDLPNIDGPNAVAAISVWTDRISRFAPAFRNGTTETRALFPTEQVEPYHRETARGLNTAALYAMDQNIAAATRMQFAQWLSQRVIYQMAHVYGSRHNYTWEGVIALAGHLLGIPEWKAARRSWALKAAPYDGSDGSLYEPTQEPDLDQTRSNRLLTWDAIGVGAPAFPGREVPAQNDAIVFSGLGAVRDVQFDPTTPADEPILPGVFNVSGTTWRIPGDRTYLGQRGFRSPTRLLDHAPLTPGTDAANRGTGPFHNVPVNPGGNYRIEWTDGSNSPAKISSYDWQHMPATAMTYLILRVLGILDHANVLYYEEAAEDHMGMTAEWIEQLTGWPNYNGGAVFASYGAQSTQTPLDASEWWAIVNAAKASGGVYASKRTPERPSRSLLSTVDAGNGQDLDLTLIGHPEDGGSPITRWQYRIDGGAEITAANPYVGVGVTAATAGPGARTVEYRVENAQGWSPWSEPKTRTIANPALAVVASDNAAAASGAPSPSLTLGNLQVGDLIVICASRTANGGMAVPAGYTAHPTFWAWRAGGSGAPERLHLATKVVTEAGDEVVSFPAGNSSFKWGLWGIAIRGGSTPTLGAIASRYQGTGASPTLTWAQINGALDPNGITLHVVGTRGGGNLTFDNGATVLNRGNTPLPGNEGVQMGQNEVNCGVIWRPTGSASQSPLTTSLRTGAVNNEDANLATIEIRTS